MTLLPPNATALERAIEAATARTGDIETPIDTLFDPATIDAEWLPWLAWGLSVDSWDADWSDADKRGAVAGSIELHRRKGTRASVEMVLARFDRLVRVVEWHQASPRRAAHTFDVVLPLAGDGIVPGGRRATAAFADAIVREVARVKPLREHFQLVQSLVSRGSIGVQGAARPTLMRRDDLIAADDRSQPWELYLQAETGEPLQSADSGFLETQP